MTVSSAREALWSHAFRPLFVGLGVVAVVTMGLWILSLRGVILSSATVGSLWHAHEMLFGFALAAVAGFVLTAVANWTGRSPVQGTTLRILLVCWLLARLVLPGAMTPSYWTSLAAMAFPVMLSVLVAREILLGGSRRNIPIAVMVALLALCEGVFQLGQLGLLSVGADRQALLAALYLLIVLITVIAGRIIPSFTGNWLRLQGKTSMPQVDPRVERVLLPATVAALLLALLLPEQPFIAVVALPVAVLHALRLARWRGLATLREPLLFVLHVAYAWIPIGFALLAASGFPRIVPFSSALHAFGVGAIGTMVLAVTTRVALGHTGRPLHAARATVAGYAVLTLAAAVRVLAPFTDGHYLGLLEFAALAWIVAWSLFLRVYAPILLQPRLETPPAELSIR